MRVAFICTANICRSVMAHAILESLVTSRGLDIEVVSAGILDFAGTPPAQNAWLTCVENHTPLSKMKSTHVGSLDLEAIDAFLVMEERHRDALVSRYAVPETKVHLLGSFAKTSGNSEIADPIGQEKRTFQDCFTRLERCIEAYLEEAL